MSDRLRLMEALQRADPAAFMERCFSTLEPGVAYQDNWHLAAMSEALRRVHGGQTKRR